MDVLVVDDSRVARTMLKQVLGAALDGAHVTAVEDLDSALECAAQGRNPDLVLLDLGLPRYSGVEALARFRRRFPRIPVAVISGTDDRDSIAQALGAGAIGYIPKSTPRDEMIAALRHIAAGEVHVPAELETTAPD